MNTKKPAPILRIAARVRGIWTAEDHPEVVRSEPKPLKINAAPRNRENRRAQENFIFFPDYGRFGTVVKLEGVE
jgi:hypothetical protein